ncbi:TIGR02808 family protein [Sansalvadorimonas verongulae]|nr:TIGR02808 family protein [Sansalvadorimonas verongulae]MTI14818.1 TIGR02808 family protein [Sansalvadorimonas verongulae]
MSQLEWVIWHVLGYAAIPGIFITGYLMTAILACILLDLFGVPVGDKKK